MTGYEEELVALIGTFGLEFVPKSENINYEFSPKKDFNSFTRSEWSNLFSNLRRELKAIPEEHALQYIRTLKQRAHIIDEWRNFVLAMMKLHSNIGALGKALSIENFNFDTGFMKEFFKYEDGMEFEEFSKDKILEKEIKAQTGKTIEQLLSNKATKFSFRMMLRSLHHVCFGVGRKWVLSFDSNRDILQQNMDAWQTVMDNIEKSYEGNFSFSIFRYYPLIKLFTNFYLSELKDFTEILQANILTLGVVEDDIIDKLNQSSGQADQADQAEEIHALRRVVSDQDEEIRALKKEIHALKQIIFELSERLSALEQRRGYEDEEKQEDPDRKQVISDRDEQIDALKQIVFELSERLSVFEERLSYNEKDSTAFQPRFFN